jgi:hypothetical protein
MEQQNELDVEKRRHNSNLYAVWNLKSFICHKIAQENPFNSSFFIYTDAGAFRDIVLPGWPDQSFITNSIQKVLGDRVLFGQVANFKVFNEWRDVIEGGFFAGSSQALSDFYRNFFFIHDERFEQGLFVGKDQTIMNLLAFKYFNRTVVRLNAWSCGANPWFFYQFYFHQASSNMPCLKDRLGFLIFN